VWQPSEGFQGLASGSWSTAPQSVVNREDRVASALQSRRSFESEELVAVAYRYGTEVERTALQSGTGLPGFDVCADRTDIRADDTDLAYIDITVVDGDGMLHHAEDREITVEVRGSGELLGLGSANPRTERDLRRAHPPEVSRTVSCRRAPTAPSTVTVTVSTAGRAPRQVTIEAR
jgi:beta-galactosidase